MSEVSSFGYHDVSPAHAPVQENLSCWSLVLCSQLLDQWLLSQIVTLGSHLGAKAAQGTVGYGHDLMVEQEPNEVRLGACWIQIDLVANGLVSRVAHDIREQLRVEVGDTDALGQTFVDEAFEAGPEYVHGHFGLRKEVVRPVQVVQVHVVSLQGFQGLAQGRLRVLVAVVPNLSGQKDLISLDFARFDTLSESLAHLCFIHSDGGSVDVAIADVGEGVLDALGVLVEERA